MQRDTIYIVDEDATERRANAAALRRLLDNQDIKVEELVPYTKFSNYNSLVASHSTAAFVLDQRMKQSGLVSYNGTELAAHLRSIDTKMPIYILTAYVDEEEDFKNYEYLVEYIIGKDEIQNQHSNQAKIVKARMRRHLDVFNDVLGDREQRFHCLLVKSLREQLTVEEQNEMDQIEGETTAPVQAAERKQEQDLGLKIAQLRRLLDTN